MSIQTEPNFVRSNSFELIIPELPIVSSMAQDFLIPALILNPAEVYNRHVDFTIPGEKIIYGELDIGFIVDDKLDGYVEIHNWMRLMAGTADQPVEQREELMCDTTLIILNNNKNMIRRFIFTDCWPTSLAAASFDLLDSGNVKSILTLRYTNLRIDPPDNDLSGFNKKVYQTEVA